MADGMLIECRLFDFIYKSSSLHHFEHISTPPNSCYKDINVWTSHFIAYKIMRYILRVVKNFKFLFINQFDDFKLFSWICTILIKFHIILRNGYLLPIHVHV